VASKSVVCVSFVDNDGERRGRVQKTPMSVELGVNVRPELASNNPNRYPYVKNGCLINLVGYALRAFTEV